MRVKDIFTISYGQKVSDRCLIKVLTGSVCCVLLCMACLLGTTWAWFKVTVESSDNVIQIGTPDIHLTVNDAQYEPGDDLMDADLLLKMTHATNNADVFDKKSMLFVTLNIENSGETKTVYAVLNEANGYAAELNIVNNTGAACKIRWVVSWFAPAQAQPLPDNTVVLPANG